MKNRLPEIFKKEPKTAHQIKSLNCTKILLELHQGTQEKSYLSVLSSKKTIFLDVGRKRTLYKQGRRLPSISGGRDIIDVQKAYLTVFMSCLL